MAIYFHKSRYGEGLRCSGIKLDQLKGQGSQRSFKNLTNQNNSAAPTENKDKAQNSTGL
jgi:hypothetical protein